MNRDQPLWSITRISESLRSLEDGAACEAGLLVFQVIDEGLDVAFCERVVFFEKILYRLVFWKRTFWDIFITDRGDRALASFL